MAFHRPAFSRIASFSQTVEPIYDAFSSELPIPPDAIKLETGNTIATAGVTLTLFSGFSLFEARLDGYKVHFPSWLTVDGGVDATGDLINRLTWLPESHDPFEIGSTEVSSQVRFDCFNTEDLWTVRVTVDKSAMPDTHLFLEISGEYAAGSHFDTLDKQAEHLSIVLKPVIDKLGLEVE